MERETTKIQDDKYEAAELADRGRHCIEVRDRQKKPFIQTRERASSEDEPEKKSIIVGSLMAKWNKNIDGHTEAIENTVRMVEKCEKAAHAQEF